MDKIAATPEQARFLLSILDPSREDSVRNQRLEIAAEVQDSDALLNIAGAHGVLPFLLSRFPEWPALADERLAARLRGECLKNTLRNLALGAELLALLEEFDAAGIPALPFKGVVLAVGLYGNLQFRPAGDLDILIHRWDLERATAILKNRDYILLTQLQPDGTPVEQDAGEYQFGQKGPAGVIVELRWRLAPPDFRRDLGMDVLWPRRRMTKVLGVAVPDLAPEDTLVLLCMHGTKHEWLRLFWICDIGQLLKVHPHLDWGMAEGLARRFGLFRALVLGVLLSHRMTGAPVPEQVLRRFKKNRTVRRLEEHIRKHFFEPTSSPFDGLPIQIEALGFGDRMARLGHAILEGPGIRDRARVRLPAALDFLYYLVRPVRLVWKYLIRRGLRFGLKQD